MYTSAFFIITIIMAKRCNSPPDNSLRSRSYSFYSSKSNLSCSLIFSASFSSMIVPTFPFMNLGILSTYCGFNADFSSYSIIFVR